MGHDLVSKSSRHLGFGVTRAENGAWVLTEVNDYDGNKHFACVDSEALYSQMRAWVEREITAHRQQEEVVAGRQTESGAWLLAAREVST